MSAFTGTITPLFTGTLNIPCGFPPTSIDIMVGARASTTEVSPRQSLGWGIGTTQYCHSWYVGSTGNRQRTYNDRIVSIWEPVSGTLTETVRVNFTGFSGNNAVLDVIINNSSYQLFIKALG